MIRLWQRLTRATQQGPDADIRTLMRREFGLRVGQRRTYDEALTHSSMLDGDKTGLKSNERLVKSVERRVTSLECGNRASTDD